MRWIPPYQVRGRLSQARNDGNTNRCILPIATQPPGGEEFRVVGQPRRRVFTLALRAWSFVPGFFPRLLDIPGDRVLGARNQTLEKEAEPWAISERAV